MHMNDSLRLTKHYHTQWLLPKLVMYPYSKVVHYYDNNLAVPSWIQEEERFCLDSNNFIILTENCLFYNIYNIYARKKVT